jgi:hypothetical protein
MKSFEHLETSAEKIIRAFSKTVCAGMGWGELPIARFKLGNTIRWKGYCYSTGDYIFINISTNPDVHPTEKDLFDTVIHELIHAYLCYSGQPICKAFGHGKAFKNVAKEIAKFTDNRFSYKRIMK